MNNRAREHTIDCDMIPFIPENLNKWLSVPAKSSIQEHQKGGILTLEDASSLGLYRAPGQDCKWAGSISSFQLEEMLRSQPILNACVLDYLLTHPELIPENWKKQHVCFYGTKYFVDFGPFWSEFNFWYIRTLDFWDGKAKPRWGIFRGGDAHYFTPTAVLCTQ